MRSFFNHLQVPDVTHSSESTKHKYTHVCVFVFVHYLISLLIKMLPAPKLPYTKVKDTGSAGGPWEKVTITPSIAGHAKPVRSQNFQCSQEDAVACLQGPASHSPSCCQLDGSPEQGGSRERHNPLYYAPAPGQPSQCQRPGTRQSHR